jgi:4-amino-4-deoxy-L-arabinose transferase-like glycosyltransferase
LAEGAVRTPVYTEAVAFRQILLPLLLGISAFLLFFHGLGNAGLLGPDEPRYADIGRAMAQSGDWVTPRLFGEPWFEKPALLYWMIASGFALGLDDTLAPRLPISVLGLLGIVAFYLALRRLPDGDAFPPERALAAAVCLAVSAGWLGFSHAAVTDLPLTVFFSAGMLLSLPWALRGDRRKLPYAAACFALASLAKGLVPLVLAFPLLVFGWRRTLDWLRPAPVLAFVAISLPWYALCFARHGQAFLDEFFWKHHVSRFFSPELQHVQPFWFYLPVLLGLLFPATPLLWSLAMRQNWRDPRFRFFALWAGFGLLFFSASTNKLPGYLLPLLPACCAMMAFGMDGSRRNRILLSLVAALVPLYALAGGVLPEALAGGIRRADFAGAPWAWLLVSAAAAILVWYLTARSSVVPALATIVLLAAASLTFVTTTALPAAGERASARGLWERIEPYAGQLCIGPYSHRAIDYGLRYYSRGRIPLCEAEDRPIPLNLRWPDESIEGLPAASPAPSTQP